MEFQFVRHLIVSEGIYFKLKLEKNPNNQIKCQTKITVYNNK